METTTKTRHKRQSKIATTLVIISFVSFSLGACALGPVESDPEKAAQRWAEMREYCYKQGGVWNDSVKTCVSAGKSY